jgi:hypothetical protein
MARNSVPYFLALTCGGSRFRATAGAAVVVYISAQMSHCLPAGGETVIPPVR